MNRVEAGKPALAGFSWDLSGSAVITLVQVHWLLQNLAQLNWPMLGLDEMVLDRLVRLRLENPLDYRHFSSGRLMMPRV